MQQYTIHRSDSHNASVDQAVAAAGLCGFMHLPSGRTCVLPARHPGSCSFQPHSQAKQQAERRRDRCLRIRSTR
jgi:hypothetical protein